MLEFLFPFSMFAGILMVSSPVIIHLINRMRFKRVRWAAMEFLIKAQKRNQRRLIIEQLILLLLRILLVLLAALIVARFLNPNWTFFKPQSRTHVVLLDDTLSMTDGWKDERGDPRTSFQEAKRVIREDIAKNAAQSNKAQQLKLLRVTRPEDEPLFDARLNDASLRDLDGVLKNVECSPLHVDLLPALQKARKLLDDASQDQRILYLVSDLRMQDWSGPTGEAARKELKALTEQGIHVKFVDVAEPARKETDKEPNYHSNLAIVSLRPEMQTVGVTMPETIFNVTVANYGQTEKANVRVRVSLNGVEQLQSSVPLKPIKPNGKEEERFSLTLNKEGLNQVRAYLDVDDEGLKLDNERYAVVNVRDKVPFLVVDGDLANAKNKDSDLFFMQVMFRASYGFDLSPGLRLDAVSPAELGDPKRKLDLSQYANIYLVNVPELNDEAIKNLEAYVRQGGTACFFVGDLTKPDHYNAKLYADGKGLFPVPLADKPTPKLEEKERDERAARRSNDPQMQVFLRDEQHKIFAPLTADPETRNIALGALYLVNIERHFPVPRDKWTAQPGRTQELLTLPNDKSMDDYKARVNTLLLKMEELTKDAKYQQYRDRLAIHRDVIRGLIGGSSLNKLSTALEFLLKDTGDPLDRVKFPNLAEFWEQEDTRRLASDFERLAEIVKYGDPLMVEGKFGKGRVVAMLTTFGQKWNDWAKSPTYPMLMYGLQRYLMSTAPGADLTLGSALDLDLDAARYKGTVKKYFKPEPTRESPAGNLESLGEDSSLQNSPAGRALFRFNEARKPGIYVLEFQPTSSDKGEVAPPEQRAFAFNVDALAEGNLARTPRSELLSIVPEPDAKDSLAKLHPLGAGGFTELSDPANDLSMGPWLYLVFLLLLVLEQAMAVHLSHHLRGGQASMPTQAFAPRPTTI